VDLAKLLLEYIQTLVWPAIVITFGWFLRRQLRTMAANLAERVKLLTEAEIGPAKLRFDAGAEKVKSTVDLVNASAEQGDADDGVSGKQDEPELIEAPGEDESPYRHVPVGPRESTKEDSKWRHPSRAALLRDIAERIDKCGLPVMEDVMDLVAVHPDQAANVAYGRLEEYVNTVAALMGVENLHVSAELALTQVSHLSGNSAWEALAAAANQLYDLVVRLSHDVDELGYPEADRQRLQVLMLTQDVARSVDRLFSSVVRNASRVAAEMGN